jgi:hypothetical protein
MIQELITEAKREGNTCWGGLLVAWVSDDGELGTLENYGFKQFVRDFAYALGDVELPNGAERIRSRWLGVVHGEGAFLMPFETKSDMSADSRDPADWWKQPN